MESTAIEATTARHVFARVLVGVDGSDAGRRAAVQAGRLVSPDGTLELAAARYLVDGNLLRWPKEQIEETLEREARPWLDEAAAAVGRRATTRLLNGPSKQALLDEARRYGATLTAVGTHEHSRLSELLIGGVTGPLLHESTCSVLVARQATSDALFPLNIVVGIDGSPSSLAALAVGDYLGERFATSVRVLLARHGDVDVVRAELHAPQLEIVDGNAVDVLVEASGTSDLVIVGNRGLHGLGAVGSVSERLAHRALSSVLVVRRHQTTHD